VLGAVLLGAVLLGTVVGLSVCTLPCCVGGREGTTLGNRLVLKVGLRDGPIVGAMVGNLVGWPAPNVGATVGFVLGNEGEEVTIGLPVGSVGP
jgi:NAD/NADP transhydrogenase beta subunit